MFKHSWVWVGGAMGEAEALHQGGVQTDHSHLALNRALLAVDAPSQVRGVVGRENAFFKRRPRTERPELSADVAKPPVSHLGRHVHEEVFSDQVSQVRKWVARAQHGVEPGGRGERLGPGLTLP